MNLEQIASLTLSNLQMLLESVKVPLAVGPISEEDYFILTTGYTELEWDFGFSRYGNRSDKFEFCLKLLTEPRKHIPAGAALCVYDEDADILQIHLVESFVRDDTGHPLSGNMFIFTLFAAYLFGAAAGCKTVEIHDTLNEKVADYYRKYGFSGDIELLSASFATLSGVVKTYIDRMKNQ